jgi:flagellar assembly factor FliW
MKVIFLNKKEKETLIKLLAPLIITPGCSYELTTILEKLDWKTYELVFKHPELFDNK